jgi:hypothetical protein
VPYRGAAPAMQDLLAGQIHMIFDNIPGALAQSRPGKVRALGVTSEGAQRQWCRTFRRLPRRCRGSISTRGPRLPDPAKLPPDVVARLSELSKKALESEDLKAKFLRPCRDRPSGRSPADTAAYRDAEEARLAPIIKASGARVSTDKKEASVLPAARTDEPSKNVRDHFSYAGPPSRALNGMVDPASTYGRASP